MINWFDMPAEGLSNGGLFEIKELTATENKVYQKDGEVYNKVTVNVEGGSSDFSTAEVTLDNTYGADNLYFGSASIVDNELIYTDIEVEPGETATTTVLLYKGKSMGVYPINGYEFTGNVIYDSENDLYYITGNCTVSVETYNVIVNSVPIPERTLGFSPMISEGVCDYRPIINGEPSTEDDIQIDLTNGVTNYQVQIAVIKPRSGGSYEAQMNESEGINPITTGAIQFVDDNGWYFNITGDGTISLASA